MALSVGDLKRAKRSLKRSIYRCDAAVDDFKEVYNVALKVKDDPFLVFLFIARKVDLEQIFADFNFEQNAIMDTLINICREEEYKTIHAVIYRETKQQYYMVQAIAQ